MSPPASRRLLWNELLEERIKTLNPLLPTKAPDYAVEDGGVPREMEKGSIDAEGWVHWTWLPSKLAMQDIAVLEKEVECEFPDVLRDYLLGHCHLFTESTVGGDRIRLFSLPSDDPLKEFRDVIQANEMLLRAGYLPIGEMGDGYGPICVDLKSEDLAAPLCWFDHEDLVNDGEIGRDALSSIRQPLMVDLETFLTEALRGAAG